MKLVNHTEENFQFGKFNCDDISYIESDVENVVTLIVLKETDEREEETHIYRASCVLTFERNFHSMILRIS